MEPLQWDSWCGVIKKAEGTPQGLLSEQSTSMKWGLESTSGFQFQNLPRHRCLGHGSRCGILSRDEFWGSAAGPRSRNQLAQGSLDLFGVLLKTHSSLTHLVSDVCLVLALKTSNVILFSQLIQPSFKPQELRVSRSGWLGSLRGNAAK